MLHIATLALGAFSAFAAPQCEYKAAYPPPDSDLFPEIDINLDEDPTTRWVAAVKPAADDIKTLINTIVKFIPPHFLGNFTQRCDANADAEFLKRFPVPYGAEIRSISDSTGIDICEIILYNIAYEVLGGCTSIVAEDPNGMVLHGRNLDFGLGPWNGTEAQWDMTDALRPLLRTVNFQRGGQLAYKSVHYLGYVGLLTGVKKGAFTITVDTRFDSNYDRFLFDWLNDRTDTAHFLTFLTRDTMEEELNFESAITRLASTRMVGPSYIIIGGVAKGEGMVITNAPNTTTAFNQWPLSKGYPKNSTSPWYLLQTNYDNWVSPPWIDNRRDPAVECMDNLGQSAISKETLYNVLHSHPSRNRLTTYTSLMNCAEGTIESSKQYCTEKGCVPW
jgi:acid ceramidase